MDRFMQAKLAKISKLGCRGNLIDALHIRRHDRSDYAGVMLHQVVLQISRLINPWRDARLGPPGGSMLPDLPCFLNVYASVRAVLDDQVLS